MKIVKTIVTIIIVIALCFWVWDLKNNPQIITNTTTVTKTDTVYKKDTIVSIEYKPKYITIVDTAWKEKDVDTLAILQAYFDKNVYNDTLVNDSALFVEVTDTITQNEIYSRKFSIIRNYPIINNHTVVTNTIEKNELFMGAYVGKIYGVQIQYNFKKHLVGGYYGNEGFFVSYSYKIK
jgi:hypothetical protein